MPSLHFPHHLRTPSGRVPGTPTGVRAQPRPPAGAAVPVQVGKHPRLARGPETAAPPTLIALPHAAPLRP